MRTHTYKSIVEPIPPEDVSAQSKPTRTIDVRAIVIVVALLLSLVLVVRYASTQINGWQQTRTPVEIELRTGLTEYPIVHLKVEPDGDGYIVTDEEDGDRFWCPMIPKSMSDEERCRYVGGE